MPLRLTKASSQIRSCESERFGCYLVGLSVPHLKELLAVYADRRGLTTPNIENTPRAVDFYSAIDPKAHPDALVSFSDSAEHARITPRIPFRRRGPKEGDSEQGKEVRSPVGHRAFSNAARTHLRPQFGLRSRPHSPARLCGSRQR